MPRYKCVVEYDGTDYCGWQKQKDVITIQQVVEEAIKGFTGQKADAVVSGRTDAGVHAMAQVFHMDVDKELEEHKIADALNFHMKKHPISILHAEKVDEAFHARFSATRRYYRYAIINRRPPLALNQKRAWHVIPKLNVEAMQDAAEHLLGHHDFTSFRDAECQAKSPMKTVDMIQVNGMDDKVTLLIHAPSFLHHMVRNIMGTLKYVGEGKLTPDDVKTILEAKDRTKAGPTAPPQGLYFEKVDYE